MPLHTDYRPRTWDEFVGNKETVDKLRSVISREDCPHTFLFSGPTGCGKTTLARIVAKELGCDDRDFIELNAAEARGIAVAREIMEKMRYKPAFGDCR